MNNELEWQVVTDPEELFRLHKAGWEVEFSTDLLSWSKWSGTGWYSSWTFHARPPKPKMKQVKMECFSINGELRWRDEKLSHLDGWLRQPHLDLIAKVPE